MVQSKAKTVKAYLEELPADRRAVIAGVMRVIRGHLPPGYEEAINWGVIVWQVPLARFPNTYNDQPLPYVALAAQKNSYSLYMMRSKELEAQLRASFKKAGRKPDMGKSCIRFKKLDDLPLDAIGKGVASMSVEDYLAHYARSRGSKTK